MARLIKHTATSSKKITVGGETISICMCGLSKNYPICDGTHHSIKDELPDVTYIYDENGNRIEIKKT